MFEEVSHEFVVVDYLKLAIPFGGVQFPEEPVHAFGVELEVALHFLHPGLIHLVEVSPDDLSHLVVYKRILLVEVDFDYVCYEEKRQLHSLGLQILWEARRDVGHLFHILVQTLICYLPLHLLQGRPQKQNLQLIHHHQFDHLQHDLPQRHSIHIRLTLPILADALEQHMRAVTELTLDKLLKLGLVAFLGLPLILAFASRVSIEHNIMLLIVIG